MVGRATLAMAPSSTVMAMAAQMVAAAHQRRGVGRPSAAFASAAPARGRRSPASRAAVLGVAV